MKMRMSIGLLLILAVFSHSGHAQHYVADYPEGFYYSYDDFVNKKVRPAVNLERHSMRGDYVFALDSIADQVFFYRVKLAEKVDDIFAIKYRGNLYFRQRELTKHARHGDGAQAGNNQNSYHRVIKDGKFFYLEGLFFDVWAKGALLNAGVTGQIMAFNLDQMKGVIYDFGNNRFDFFRQCKDFNNFLKEQHYDGQADCKTYNIQTVRDIIDKIIKPE